MKTKWLVWWRDGSVSIFDAAQWTAAQLTAMANVIDAALCTEAVAAEVREWWESDGSGFHWTTDALAFYSRHWQTAHAMAEAVDAS